MLWHLNIHLPFFLWISQARSEPPASTDIEFNASSHLFLFIALLRSSNRAPKRHYLLDPNQAAINLSFQQPIVANTGRAKLYLYLPSLDEAP